MFIRSALLRALPMSIRIRAALEGQGLDCRYDFDMDSWVNAGSDFFFDDGSPLRSCFVLTAGATPAAVTARLGEAGLFSKREFNSICAQDSAFEESSPASVIVYWPAEKTPLEKWISGRGPLTAAELLPTKEKTSVEQLPLPVEEPAPPTDRPPTPPSREPLKPLAAWNSIRYGVVGSLRGGSHRKSFLLQRSTTLCFAMMSGERNLVQERHTPFVDYLKRIEDWPSAHRIYCLKNQEPLETLSISLDRDGHCRFFCKGIQPVYWSGRLKKLMRFPDTEAPLNSRLHPGDFVLLIPGSWTARDAAELRE